MVEVSGADDGTGNKDGGGNGEGDEAASSLEYKRGVHDGDQEQDAFQALPGGGADRGTIGGGGEDGEPVAVVEDDADTQKQDDQRQVERRFLGAGQAGEGALPARRAGLGLLSAPGPLAGHRPPV